jgi:hypothetical protein
MPRAFTDTQELTAFSNRLLRLADEGVQTATKAFVADRLDEAVDWMYAEAPADEGELRRRPWRLGRSDRHRRAGPPVPVLRRARHQRHPAQPVRPAHSRPPRASDQARSRRAAPGAVRVRSLTDELIDVLRDGGLTVGDGKGPGTAPPFVVVHPLVETRDGSFADGWSDVAKFYELVCEGADRWQSEWTADLAKLLIARSSMVVGEITTARTDRTDATGSPSRWQTWVRVQLLAHSPTGA